LLSKISEGFDCKGGALIIVELFFAEISLSEVSLTVTGVFAEASASWERADTLVKLRLYKPGPSDRIFLGLDVVLFLPLTNLYDSTRTKVNISTAPMTQPTRMPVLASFVWFEWIS